MSTRAQVKIVDGNGDELWFYRHSDGYPKGAMPTLEKFLAWVKEGRIRNNVEQAAGWLILIGAEEYNEFYKDGAMVKKTTLTEPSGDGLSGWQCGSYQPCPCRDLHGDVEYLYTIDLAKKTIEVKKL
jgi:hypothetical protein